MIHQTNNNEMSLSFNLKYIITMAKWLLKQLEI